MRIIAAVAFIVLPITAEAACIGSSALSTCYDNSGNSYTVRRLGNTTYLDGRNSNGTWSQRSTTTGSWTQHNGVDIDGNSWQENCFNGVCD